MPHRILVHVCSYSMVHKGGWAHQEDGGWMDLALACLGVHACFFKMWVQVFFGDLEIESRESSGVPQTKNLSGEGDGSKTKKEKTTRLTLIFWYPTPKKPSPGRTEKTPRDGTGDSMADSAVISARL